MSAENNYQHPYIQQKDSIAEREVVVIDYVTSMPAYGETCIAPDLLIVICHQGTVWTEEMADPTFGTHDVSILLPEQVVISSHVSDDFKATIIVVARKFAERLKHSYPYTRYDPLFRRRPATHLTEKQYNSLLDAVNLLRTLTQSKSVHRSEMLSGLLSIIINMIGEYHVSNYPGGFNLTSNEQLFNRFYNALIQHYRESHEVAFYARICCLSPKHFSDVIKRETGISAFEWIGTYITLQAKSLLDSRRDYSIQQVSSHLGFSEQSAFTRFFKKQTGMTPSIYRDRVEY